MNGITPYFVKAGQFVTGASCQASGYVIGQTGRQISPLTFLRGQHHLLLGFRVLQLVRAEALQLRFDVGSHLGQVLQGRAGGGGHLE